MGRAREQFLSDAAAPPGSAGAPRAEISASWARSRQLAVDTDRVEPLFVERLDQETLLARSAAPILESLKAELAGEPIGILVTDAHGTVLDRQCPDPGMLRLLDAARLAPGFVFAESSVGTNGIGVALEMRTPTMVTGSEHYVESLKRFGCAGAPVLHPVTGAFMGVIDFTTTAPHVNPLLLTFARSTARRVQDQLLLQTSARELSLMRDYLAACHHTGGSVLAVSDDLVMMNVQAQQHFDLADQAALLARVGDIAGMDRAQTLVAELPSGGTVRMDYRPVVVGGGQAGGVVRVQGSAGARRPRTAGGASSTSLPGVVGTSLVWQQTCHRVVQSRRDDEWLVLEGEAGVGRATLAQAAHRSVHPAAPTTVLDAADAEPGADWLDQVSAALTDHDGMLLLREVQRLPAELLAELAGRLAAAAAAGSGPWVALTLAPGPRPAAVDAELLPLFPRTVQVPPLRQHLDDLDRLVPHLLGRLVRGADLSMSPAAVNQLKRLPWPGNVPQLYQLLLQVTRRRRSGVVTVDDLPAAGRATSRRSLTPLEALERDAIVAALDSAAGSRSQAAAALGMSRATIYRRIKDFGIHTD